MWQSELRPSMRRCYEFLNLTSRSFAAVIQALDPELRPAICLFYLILRGLYTIEDDMSIDPKVKVPELEAFHERLYTPGWTFTQSGPKEKDRQLLVEFDVVIEEFAQLAPKYQEVIADITLRMGNGMAEFVHKGSTETIKDYNLYCHYVAGLVGIGLAKLFSASGLESAKVGKDEAMANSMGLFLQKTNIIRDYLEDLEEGRTWYPREVWSLYAGQLADLAQPPNRAQALQCLNHLVTDALRHIPDVFTFMSRIKNPTVFSFCAIPQVMAVATLELLYNNGGVFEGVVKIRKGLAVQLMLQSRNYDQLLAVFERFTLRFEKKLGIVAADDASLEQTRKNLNVARALLAKARADGVLTASPGQSDTFMRVLLMAGAAYLGYHALCGDGDCGYGATVGGAAP